MNRTVIVIGGGYGGIATAKALDDVADVVLVEPRDTFVHNVAVLRALVDPDWIDRIFLPYERLLDCGRVVRDRAVRVDVDAVKLGSGERIATRTPIRSRRAPVCKYSDDDVDARNHSEDPSF